jgi:hypothetical protein
MMSQSARPKWWRLYGIAALLVGLFVLEGRLPLTGAEHEIFEIGLLLGGYGLIWWWLNANYSALLQSEQRPAASIYADLELRSAPAEIPAPPTGLPDETARLGWHEPLETRQRERQA